MASFLNGFRICINSNASFISSYIYIYDIYGWDTFLYINEQTNAIFVRIEAHETLPNWDVRYEPSSFDSPMIIMSMFPGMSAFTESYLLLCEFTFKYAITILLLFFILTFLRTTLASW